MPAQKDPIKALSVKERTHLVRLMQQYMRDHFDLEAGDLGTELLLERAGELIGPLYWNEALRQAAAVLSDHSDMAAADLLAREKELERRHREPAD
jgi:uncharacterized protein (DUF2164 family)